MKEKIAEMTEKLNNLSPSAENEAKIRSLCHEIMNSSSQWSLSQTKKNEAEKLCFEKLNALERKLILESSGERNCPIYKYDFPALIKNTVCACDVLLPKHRLIFGNSPSSPFYAVCNEKLITRAVCEMAMCFFDSFNKGTVIFSAQKKNYYSILSAVITGNSQKEEICGEETFSVLSKIAKVHGGAFMTERKESVTKLCLSVKNTDTQKAQLRRIPGYMEMLFDRFSVVHTVLGK